MSGQRHPIGDRTSKAGFTLVELIMAIVIITVGAAFTLQGFVTPARSIEYDIEVQTVTQTAQACAEHILHLREIQTMGWANVPVGATTLCDGVTLPAGYTRNLAIATIATDPPCSASFPANSCREITITVSKTGGKVAAVAYKFTLINY